DPESHATQSSRGRALAPHLAVSARGWPGSHLGLAQLYGGDVSTPDRQGASLQSAVHRTVSRPSGTSWGSRMPDGGAGKVDLVVVATRAIRGLPAQSSNRFL